MPEVSNKSSEGAQPQSKSRRAWPGGIPVTTSYAVIPGAGSAGLTWSEVAGELGAALVRTPDEMSVPGMAAGRREAIGDLPRPRVLVGPSMGAMVSLATARHVEVDAMVLTAAGFGTEVSDRLVDEAQSARNRGRLQRGRTRKAHSPAAGVGRLSARAAA
ncbi:MAG: hypothetical protein WBP81_26720 [Solirubrobacteraceae bacterium]